MDNQDVEFVTAYTIARELCRLLGRDPESDLAVADDDGALAIVAGVRVQIAEIPTARGYLRVAIDLDEGASTYATKFKITPQELGADIDELSRRVLAPTLASLGFAITETGANG